MGLLTAALRFGVDASLGGWLGIMAFFSFVGAPRAFAVFDDDAGEYVNDVFPRYYRIGIVLGTVALLGELALGTVTTFGAAGVTALVTTIIAVGFTAYAQWVLIPKMDVADEDAFATYHRQSVLLNGTTMLAVTLSLLAIHAP